MYHSYKNSVIPSETKNIEIYSRGSITNDLSKQLKAFL